MQKGAAVVGEILTINETAAELSAIDETVRWLIHKGMLRAVRPRGQRTVYVLGEDVDRLRDGTWRQNKIRARTQEDAHASGDRYDRGLELLDRFVDCGSKRLRISKLRPGALWHEARTVFVESRGTKFPTAAKESLRKRAEEHSHCHPSGEDQMAAELWRWLWPDES